MAIFREHKTSSDRSAADRRRHREKIDKALKEGIQNIIADESIIGVNGNKKLRIPVRGIKEYQFIFGDNIKQVGAAPGKDLQKGQRIKGQEQPQKGGPGAGSEPGEEMYDVEISVDDLAAYLFDSLDLPDLEKKQLKNMMAYKPRRAGYRNHGIWPRISKKETMKRRIRRRAASVFSETYDPESGDSFPFIEEDLRYKHVSAKPKENTAAVIFFMMDVSGSMTNEKKFMARSFFFLLYHFIRYKYETVDLVFISHTTDAAEVNEDQFFKRASSGGTMVSSAPKKALEIIKSRYSPDSWNIYAFHCSDGDNFDTDNADALALSEELRDISQLYAYCEIVPNEERIKSAFGNQFKTMADVYLPLIDSRFKIVRIGSPKEIWDQFKRLFGGKFQDVMSSIPTDDMVN